MYQITLSLSFMSNNTQRFPELDAAVFKKDFPAMYDFYNYWARLKQGDVTSIQR